jgi:hypothetical protein
VGTGGREDRRVRPTPSGRSHGFRAAGEIAGWEIGPYCNTATCTVPQGVAVGNNNNIPATVEVSFSEHLITKITVSFSQTYWDEELTVLDQKYGVNWTSERNNIPITNYETKCPSGEFLNQVNQL